MFSFDMLHFGHANECRQAKALSNRRRSLERRDHETQRPTDFDEQ